MSHQVLARKWRPRIFREMVGQEHVLQALVNALEQDRLHHAYLFTGTRGVGKTTVARILAKCFNCEAGVTSEPCGKCGSCLEIAEGRSIDLLEVDAASRTKVEDTRELLENVQYAPTRSRYKVYLIDEVHMLSGNSFNALLKTLEEPPPHVKFLLATTDPQKLPATVLSRCLQFNLKNMSAELIVGHLQYVLAQENVEFEEPALWLLARAADGSMRDALSLTDQALAFGSGQLPEADVRTMLGTVELSFVLRLVTAVAQQDGAQALQVVAEMSGHAPDYAGALAEMASLLHRIAIVQAVPEALDNSWGEREQLQALAAAMTAEDSQLYYQLALTGHRDIGLATDLRSGFEMTLLRMIAFRPAAVIDESLAAADVQAGAAEVAVPAKKPAAARAPAPEASAAATDTAVPPGTAPVVTDAATDTAAVAPAEPAADEAVAPALAAGAVTGRVPLHAAHWAELLAALGLHGILYNVAAHCVLRQVEGATAHLVLDEANAALYDERHAQRIGQALSKYMQEPIQVCIEIGTPAAETPAARSQRLQDDAQTQAQAALETDPGVRLLLERFAGVLDPDSITPVEQTRNNPESPQV